MSYMFCNSVGNRSFTTVEIAVYIVSNLVEDASGSFRNRAANGRGQLGMGHPHLSRVKSLA
jgi:hypothetical protein